MKGSEKIMVFWRIKQNAHVLRCLNMLLVILTNCKLQNHECKYKPLAPKLSWKHIKILLKY